MKSILIFLLGLFTSVIIAIAVGFFFYFSKPTPQIIQGETSNVSGTVIVPKPLLNEIKNGTGRLTVLLSKNNDKDAKNLGYIELLKPSFPFKFGLSLRPEITVKDLEKNPGDHFPPVFNLRATYYFSEAVGTTVPDVRYVESNTIIAAADLKKVLLNHNEKIDAGNLYFTRYHAQKNTDQCLPGDKLFSGQVYPTPEFTKQFGKSKFALVVSPFPRTVSDMSVVPENFDKSLYLYRFLDFSAGSLPISLPLPAVPLAAPPEFSIFAIECNPDDALAACVRRAYPNRTAGGQNVYRVLADKFIIPFCGMQNVKMYVNPKRFSGTPLRAAAPNPANPTSPAEYVEDGALL